MIFRQKLKKLYFLKFIETICNRLLKRDLLSAVCL